AKNKNYDSDACWVVGINANSARMVDSVFKQFINIAGVKSLNIESENVDEELIQKCILTGFSDRVAKRINEANLKCDIVHSGRGELARGSVVQNSQLFVAAEINEIGNHSGEASMILSKATAIKEEWLCELYPSEIRKGVQRHYFDQQLRRVMVEEETLFRGLCLNRVHKDAEPSEITAAILSEQILSGNLKLSDWDDSLEQWFLRVNFLAKWCPELNIPEIVEQDKIMVLKKFCGDSISYKEIKDKPVKPLFYALLTYEQQKALEIYAPQRLKLSNGRTPKVIYVNNGAPYISLRIQELYDVMIVPKIAMERVDVQVHILAPNMRPVQITSDLAGFWDKHYPALKQQFQRLYPKHQWR
ncbi:MAG TPA: ATP-dependent helicase C-terminal domain-containing protein, partial [Verrucomicrobiota bacterium]|nr:ATP-dependent helicase C-terminal domain-containing protein [Verrucomicrobiota bacterium]